MVDAPACDAGNPVFFVRDDGMFASDHVAWPHEAGWEYLQTRRGPVRRVDVIGIYNTHEEACAAMTEARALADVMGDGWDLLHPISHEDIDLRIVFDKAQRTVAVHPDSWATLAFMLRRPKFFGRIIGGVAEAYRSQAVNDQKLGEIAYDIVRKIETHFAPVGTRVRVSVGAPRIELELTIGACQHCFGHGKRWDPRTGQPEWCRWCRATEATHPNREDDPSR